MQPQKKLRRLSLPIVMLGLIACANSYGQTESRTIASGLQPSPAQDSETLKALEIANIRLRAAEERNKLLEDRLVAKDEIIKAKDGTIAVRDEQLKLAQENRRDLGQIATIDQFRIEACQQQLTAANIEINRLRNPPFLKRMFSPESLFGFGFGYGLSEIRK